VDSSSQEPPGPEKGGGTGGSRKESSAETLAARTVDRIRKGRERGQVVLEGLQERRPRSPFIDLVFRIGERDRDIYAGTLAGALVFRFFLFLLPWALALFALLGFVISRDAGSAQGLVDRFGLSSALAQALVDAAGQARPNRWWALLVGLSGAAWASLGAVRALRLAHFLAWDQTPQPLRRPHRAAGAFIAANVVLLAAPLLTEWFRAFVGTFGNLVHILGMFALYVAFWLYVAVNLPHREMPVRYLVPGAVLIAVGNHVLHLLTVYLLGPRVEHATSVYGAIGAATVILTWLFVIGRLIIGAAVLNAVLDERRRRHRPLHAPEG
jgi:uncharacterized BrkB/YihY/UPF0761 family membrane protein